MSRRLVTRSRPRESEEETVWISFSDFMLALLTVFMLAAVALVFSLTEEQNSLKAAMLEVEQAKAEAEQATARSNTFDSMLDSLGTGEQVRSTMVVEIRDALAARGIQVEVDPANSVLRVPVELLGFDSGSSDIRPEHEANALAIGEVIAEVLLTDDRYATLDTVFVEGHTDDVPLDGVFGGNWGLSTDRAIALWRLWEDRLPSRLGGLSGHTGERLFSVSGYGETRPVNAVQDTDDARAANRRIDIRFTEHRLSEEEITAIRAATAPSGS
ncbi:OmpA family protein [Cellulomonas cellasea]|uniref:Flagellar motor protein MotB n=1 Tax=Cellulomonas cellasea TaxID=43670 RepID=A0A7W4UF90_9CELL|nr:OmpA family protein [Cellulomonas cellasea]MBB2922997.1 flagellar motor protein MotB [Cellulomonas cellasea]